MQLGVQLRMLVRVWAWFLFAVALEVVCEDRVLAGWHSAVILGLSRFPSRVSAVGYQQLLFKSFLQFDKGSELWFRRR